MTTIFRKFVFIFALACMALSFDATPARADEGGDSGCKPCVEVQKTVKKKATHVKKTKKSKRAYSKAGKTSDVIRSAQEHLKHLGYYTGKIDGVMGPATKSAIRNFQREHGLKADGILGPKTIRALEEADKVMPRSSSSYSGAKRPFMTHEYTDTVADEDDIHQDYQPPFRRGVKSVYSRFTGLNITGSPSDGIGQRYSVVLNGQPLLMAGDQSSVIGVSKTYEVGDVDAVILTTYNADSTLCSYSTYVVVLGPKEGKLLEIENCTRAYEAEVTNGALIISFPERDDNRMLGATWRLEGFSLTRL
ncbi:MAG: peptidoglycan-binding domain-containing protein [Bdellovibrionales bacterium]